jgi:hypothetical protein
VTTDDLKRAYFLWRSIEDAEWLLAAYRGGDGREVRAFLQEPDGPPSEEYSVTLGEWNVRAAIVEALEQRLSAYWTELTELGVTPSC